MNSGKIIGRIGSLDLPAKVKAELTLLWYRAGRLGKAVVKFVESHRRFGGSMALGIALAYLLTQIPWVGGFLAMCALVTAAAIGLMREMREDLIRLFEPVL